MKKLNFHAAHKRLWTWLQYHPHLEKEDWPEWEENGGKICFISDLCFPCEVALQIYTAKTTLKSILTACHYCPINWGICPRCVTSFRTGIYNKWCQGNVFKRAEYAKIIANLPWKGKKLYQIP